MGGFWDTQPKDKGNDAPKPSESTGAKSKKKPTLTTPLKKDMAPSIEFESWCTNVLSSWSSKIDGKLSKLKNVFQSIHILYF